MNLLPQNNDPRRVPIVSGSKPNLEPGSSYFSEAIIIGLILGLVTFTFQTQIKNFASGFLAPADFSDQPPQKEAATLEFALEAPEFARQGESFEVRAWITNASDRAAQAVLFPVSEAAFQSSNLPSVITLAPRDKKLFTWKTTAQDLGSWQLGYRVNSDSGFSASAEKNVAVLPPELKIWLDPGPIEQTKTPGGVFPLTVRWQNQSQAAVQKPVLKITGNPNVLVLNAEGISRTVNFSQTLRPGASGSFQVSLKLQPKIISGTELALSDLALGGTLDYEFATPLGKQKRSLNLASNPSALRLQAFSRIYDSRGLMITSGPMPLQAEAPSRVWVNLELGIESQALKNIQTVGRLAPGVKFTGRTWINNQDELELDLNNNSFMWKTAGPLPTKNLSLIPRVGFEVEILPTANDAGGFPKLVVDLEAEARSTSSQKIVRISHEPVTADQRLDRFAFDIGVVRKP
ncbi:MAG: hypothetical protein V1821_03165 [bacterium]